MKIFNTKRPIAVVHVTCKGCGSGNYYFNYKGDEILTCQLCKEPIDISDLKIIKRRWGSINQCYCCGSTRVFFEQNAKEYYCTDCKQRFKRR